MSPLPSKPNISHDYAAEYLSGMAKDPLFRGSLPADPSANQELRDLAMRVESAAERIEASVAKFELLQEIAELPSQVRQSVRAMMNVSAVGRK